MTPFITDDELRARYGDEAELLIDALDRKVETQKFANFSRDREAVEAAIRAKMDACPDCGASGNCAPGCPSRL
jgi:microcystin degradation protein MlrC